MKISYEYDAAGNRTKKTADGVETTYVYDPANRLTSETTGGNTITYGYDYRGNLTSKTEGSDVTSYEWDSRNRLTKVTFPNASTESYEYDAQDKRITKVNASSTTKYEWDGENVLQERDGAGAVQAHYTNAPGTWGSLVSQRRGSTSSFYSFDPQSSTRHLSDASGAITDSYEYSAYGEELSSSGGTVNPFRYNGQWGYYRDNSQRLYVRARYYQPRQGAWMSQDPIGFDGGDWNLYKYVANNPVNEVDPSGLYSRGQCFWDWYNYYLKRFIPENACSLAKRKCGSNINCDNISPPKTPKPTPGGNPNKPYCPPITGPFTAPNGRINYDVCMAACQSGHNMPALALRACYTVCQHAQNRTCDWLFQRCGTYIAKHHKEACMATYLGLQCYQD